MCKLYYQRWGGNAIAGKINLLGKADIPEGYTLVAMFLSPVCNVHITMSYQTVGDDTLVYAWSESYSGNFYYEVLMILK